MPPKKSMSGGSKSTKKQKLNDSSSLDTTTDRILSKEEEEEMSSALIAQLLAQEGGGDGNGYYAEYNNDIHYGGFGGGGGRGGDSDYSDEDEDYRHDYNYKPKSKSKRAAGRKKAKPAPAPVAKPIPKPTAKSTPKSAPPAATATTATTTTTSATPTTTLETTINTASNATETAAVVSSGETATAPSSTDAGDGIATTPKVEVAAAPAVPKVKLVKEAPTGYNTGVYSETEERAFVEALDIFGRNWRSVEQHVATRDANSIRSHAQKHFIKLFRDNIPLPAKVLESGPGYTLSGNDLNPYSSAARPYLSQRMLDDPSLLPIQGGTIFTPDSTAAIKAEKAQAKEKKVVEALEAKDAKESMKEAVKEMKELKIRKAPKVHKESSRARVDNSSDEPVYTGRTDYSKARLRSARDRSSIHYRQMASDLDPLTMVKCEPFCGQPNSGVVGCQPFGIKVQSNVLLGMDFHAHLMTSEIIGFLAGEWTPATRTIHVKAIFPCRSLPTEHNHINVEMDPTSEFEVRQEIEKRNMRIVGWYHSHPTFTPDPSLVDIENQTSYQSLFKDEAMNEEPFVGAIVGPYDERLPGLSSVINWFYISQSPQERGHPKRLVYDLIEDERLPEEESSLWVKLFDEYRDSPERTNFKEQWRQEENETKLQKMLVSLGRRMPWLRNSLLKSQEQEQEQEQEKEKEGEQEGAVASGDGQDVDEVAGKAAAVAETPTVAVVTVSGEASESAIMDPEILPAAAVEAEEKIVEDEDVAVLAVLAAEVLATSSSTDSSSEAMEGVESTAPQEEKDGEKNGEKVESENVEVESEPEAKPKAEESKTESKDDEGDEDTNESKDEDVSLDVGETDGLDSQDQGQGMVRSLSNASFASAASASSSASSVSSSLSSSSATSSSHQSQGSSKAWAAATFGGLIKDPFLALVEQELSGWESVIG
ncbi:hypothetical protein BG015_001945 [Linnemannia schmuckeri]|uniref:Myb-like, SWIRM and MPN domain-containing protein 1 n=1 Tax=Linnemannia schmuckeri TaxID=64567 RepID=A0A9P5VDP4_9FUNG|nr:hypothetical protein BG015_001945 [Linnemannia schmuckeri]